MELAQQIALQFFAPLVLQLFLDKSLYTLYRKQIHKYDSFMVNSTRFL